MSKRPRRNNCSTFEAKVAFAAISGDRTIAQLADQFDVDENQITTSKARLEGGAADVFGLAAVSAGQPAGRREGSARQDRRADLGDDFRGRAQQAGLLNARR